MPQQENFWNPYRLIPVRDGIDRKKPLTHEKFQGVSGVMQCSLENLTPLFVSRGNIGDPRQFMTRDNKPVIPGSSLKGVFRSLAETIGGGCCVTDSGQGECHQNFKACERAHQLCVACRIFGMMERRGNARVHQGKVGIGDAMMENETPEYKRYEVLLSGPQIRHRSFYFTPQTGKFDRKARKLYFHQPKANERFPMVPQNLKSHAWQVNGLTAGHRFAFEVTFSGLRNEELGLLLYVIALEPAVNVVIEAEENNSLKLKGPLRHKIGNAKPFGMGSCAITITQLTYSGKPADRFASLTDSSAVVLNGVQLSDEIKKRTVLYANDRSATMQQLRKMMVWDESDDRTFRYPDYHWFKNPANTERQLKRI